MNTSHLLQERDGMLTKKEKINSTDNESASAIRQGLLWFEVGVRNQMRILSALRTHEQRIESL